MKKVLSILVYNQPGVLMRVASMFSRRGYNIESLAVGETDNAQFSRITVTMTADDAMLKQVTKQLAKLIEVKAVAVLPPEASVARGMALIKVNGEKRMELFKLAEIFRAGIVDVCPGSLTFEITGDEDKINAFAQSLAPYGILEMARTGVIGLQRSEKTIYNHGKGAINSDISFFEAAGAL